MNIRRELLSKVVDDLQVNNKGVVIYGARQVGKTTLVNEVLSSLGLKTLYLNGDQQGYWYEALISRDLSKITLLVSGYQALFVDEAQRIPEIGLGLKIILDNFPHVKVIVTGSSSLDLASKISEPLTGRVYSHRLYPISQTELSKIQTPYEMKNNLEERLIFGSYPGLFSLPGLEAKGEYLRSLTDAYLYKDLLEFGDIRNSTKIRDLLKLLAFQIGSQVSLTELGKSLELHRTTVERYIDLLEKSFIIFRLHGFSRNLRKEVTKMDKIYFYDVGIRNAIIGNLNFINNRDDMGKIWENFLLAERIKKKDYQGALYSNYFWRLSSGAELDLVEEENGQLSGFEFKFSRKLVNSPVSWKETYPEADFTLVNRDNYNLFVV